MSKNCNCNLTVQNKLGIQDIWCPLKNIHSTVKEIHDYYEYCNLIRQRNLALQNVLCPFQNAYCIAKELYNYFELIDRQQTIKCWPNTFTPPQNENKFKTEQGKTQLPSDEEAFSSICLSLVLHFEENLCPTKIEVENVHECHKPAILPTTPTVDYESENESIVEIPKDDEPDIGIAVEEMAMILMILEIEFIEDDNEDEEKGTSLLERAGTDSITMTTTIGVEYIDDKNKQKIEGTSIFVQRSKFKMKDKNIVGKKKIEAIEEKIDSGVDDITHKTKQTEIIDKDLQKTEGTSNVFHDSKIGAKDKKGDVIKEKIDKNLSEKEKVGQSKQTEDHKKLESTSSKFEEGDIVGGEKKGTRREKIDNRIGDEISKMGQSKIGAKDQQKIEDTSKILEQGKITKTDDTLSSKKISVSKETIDKKMKISIEDQQKIDGTFDREKILDDDVDEKQISRKGEVEKTRKPNMEDEDQQKTKDISSKFGENNIMDSERMGPIGGKIDDKRGQIEKGEQPKLLDEDEQQKIKGISSKFGKDNLVDREQVGAIKEKADKIEKGEKTKLADKDQPQNIKGTSSKLGKDNLVDTEQAGAIERKDEKIGHIEKGEQSKLVYEDQQQKIKDASSKFGEDNLADKEEIGAIKRKDDKIGQIERGEQLKLTDEDQQQKIKDTSSKYGEGNLVDREQTGAIKAKDDKIGQTEKGKQPKPIVKDDQQKIKGTSSKVSEDNLVDRRKIGTIEKKAEDKIGQIEKGEQKEQKLTTKDQQQKIKGTPSKVDEDNFVDRNKIGAIKETVDDKIGLIEKGEQPKPMAKDDQQKIKGTSSKVDEDYLLDIKKIGAIEQKGDSKISEIKKKEQLNIADDDQDKTKRSSRKSGDEDIVDTKEKGAIEEKVATKKIVDNELGETEAEGQPQTMDDVKEQILQYSADELTKLLLVIDIQHIADNDQEQIERQKEEEKEEELKEIIEESDEKLSVPDVVSEPEEIIKEPDVKLSVPDVVSEPEEIIDVIEKHDIEEQLPKVEISSTSFHSIKSEKSEIIPIEPSIDYRVDENIPKPEEIIDDDFEGPIEVDEPKVEISATSFHSVKEIEVEQKPERIPKIQEITKVITEDKKKIRKDQEKHKVKKSISEEKPPIGFTWSNYDPCNPCNPSCNSSRRRRKKRREEKCKDKK